MKIKNHYWEDMLSEERDEVEWNLAEDSIQEQFDNEITEQLGKKDDETST